MLDGFDTGITIFAEEADDENDENAWNCIIDAVEFSSRKAYENEGAKYFPEPIELVDDNLIEHFLYCYDEESGQLLLNLEPGSHKVGLLLVDRAGNSKSIPEVSHLAIGNYRVWIATGSISGAAVIAALALFIAKSIRRRKKF